MYTFSYQIFKYPTAHEQAQHIVYAALLGAGRGMKYYKTIDNKSLGNVLLEKAERHRAA